MTLSSIPRAALSNRPAVLFTIIAALALLGLSPRQAQAAIHYVTTTGTGNGSSWSMATSNLQGAITNSVSGDQVWVKKGTYTGTFTATDGVAVYGGFAGTETMLSQRNVAANPTILDGNSAGSVYTIPSSASGTNTLDGFTVQHGNSPTGYGGGVVDSSTRDTLIVANCAFVSNYAVYKGGGVYVDGMATITNCTFTGNTTNYYGGSGLAAGGGTLTVTGCTFTDNTATGSNGGSGGGMYVSGTTSTISNCKFMSNSVTSGNNGGGGGVYIANGTSTITGCTFTGNTATQGSGGSANGGGVAAKSCTVTITGCTVTDNSVAGTNDTGGGIYLYLDGYTISGCTFMGNTASESGGSGGGLGIISGTGSVTDCTFTDNTASAVASGSSGGGGGIYDDTGNITVARCTLQGNVPDALDLYATGSSGTTTLVKDSLIVGTGTTPSDSSGIDIDVGGTNVTSYVTAANDTIVKSNVGVLIGGTRMGAIMVANNILDGNGGGVDSVSGTVPFTSSHNDVFGNVNYGYMGVSLGSSDLTVDPKFNNAADGDYYVLLGSPVIDAGDDSYVLSGDKDLAKHSRILGARVDIGAYEGTQPANLSTSSPASVQAGHDAFTLTLGGTDFLPTSVVVFNGVNLATTYVSSTKLTATVPASLVTTAGAFKFAVDNPGAFGSGSRTLTVTAASTLTSLSPSSAPAGSASFTLTVTGTNFVSGAVVTFGGTALTTTYVSSTELTATVSASLVMTAGMVSVTAANPNVTATNALTFTVTATAPTITSFTPTSGPVGTVVTITGTNLNGVTAVRFHNANATVFSANAAGTQLTVTVPSGAGTGTITVTTPAGQVKTATPFTVVVPPTITSFSPTSGPVGTVVTIDGANLNGVTAVRFHNANATVFSVNAGGTQLTVTVPSGAGTGTITVTTPGGVVKTATAFTVN